jgi:FkbM family methyltransferase
LTEFYKISPGLALWLWRHAREFDVIHVHALFSFSSIAACVVGRIRDVPYVVRPLGTLAIYGVTKRRPGLKRLSLRFIEKPILRHAAAVHFTSLTEKEEAAALGVPFRGVVIPLGVAAVANGRANKISGKVCETILYLSRIDRKKNVEGLLRAFAIVVEGRPNVRLQIAGSGAVDYVASLESLSVELGVADKVQWLGHVSGTVKAEALARADIFVLPSFSENFGVAVVEAMLSGLPTVLGEGVAIAKQTETAGAGISTTPEPLAISEAIGCLLDDAALRDLMGARAKVFAEREYSTARMAEQLRGLYDSLCRLNNSGQSSSGLARALVLNRIDSGITHKNPQSAWQGALSDILLRIRPAMLAAILKRALMVKRIVVDTPYGKFWVDPASTFGRQLCRHGTYESGMLKTIEKHLPPGGVFFDLGANEGYFTVIGAMRCGAAGRVVAVEPQVRLLGVIDENLLLNGVTWAKVENVAVNDRPGQVTIHLAANTNSGSSGLHRSTNYRLPTQEVTAKTLYQVLAEVGMEQVDLMKVDIEGFEYEAILGSPEVFRERRVRALALEIHPTLLANRSKDAHEITKLLDSCGYELVNSDGNDVWLAPVLG